MEFAELLALITTIALVLTLGTLIRYTVIANEQRKITAEALQLQKDVRRDDLEAKDLHFEAGRWSAKTDAHIIQLTSRGSDIMGWSVTPVERPDAIWAVSPFKGDFWKSGVTRSLRFDRVGEGSGDTGFSFRINYRTGIEGDSTTKCFRITRTGVVPETCPESKKAYEAGGN